MNQQDFKENELVIYINGTDIEVGKIKRLCEDGAFVWYHEGGTAAKTPYDKLHKMTNPQCIIGTSLGIDINDRLPMRSRELHIAASPLVDYLYEYGCPHSCIIVTQTSAELLEGECSAVYEARD